MFKKAIKHDAKLRMTINGPAGAGKTYTALLFAHELGDKVAVVDTEHGSASKYADRWGFDVLELDSFHPQKYIDAIHDAENAGYDVIVLDSLSHAWAGTDGLLDEVQKISQQSRSGNSYIAWGKATPIQNRLIDTIIGAKLHVIATMRTKQEYILEESGGKQIPKKVGMAPIQRDGVEYEFDIVAEMDPKTNAMTVTKTRCPELSGTRGVFEPPTAQVMNIIKKWLLGAGPPLSVVREIPPALEPEVQPEQKAPTEPEAPRRYAAIESETFRIPDDLDLSDEAKFKRALEMKIWFGDHKNKTLGDLYLDQKGYMKWLTETGEKDFTPGNGKEEALKRAAIFLRGRRKLDEAKAFDEHLMPEGLGESPAEAAS